LLRADETFVEEKEKPDITRIKLDPDQYEPILEGLYKKYDGHEQLDRDCQQYPKS
jgi:hypothetical protein